MGEVGKCPKCGADTEYRIEGSTEGFFCTQCDWSLVTTRIPEIAQDITKYRIYILSADLHNKEQLKAISEVANINILEARKMAQELKPLMFEGEALEIEKAISVLDNVNIKYEIEPEFPY